MANIYVRSTDGNDADNGSTWALAKATVGSATTIDAAGDTIWLSQVHSETFAGGITLNFAGTTATPSRLLCGNDAAEPPTSLATSAVVATTGASAISVVGSIYCYGVTFKAGTSGSARFNPVSTSTAKQTYEGCSFDTSANTGTGTAGMEMFPGTTGLLEFRNSTFKFGHANQTILYRTGEARFIGCSILSGGTSPSSLFSAVSNAAIVGKILLDACDFTNLGATANLFAANQGQVFATVRNCKLPASWSGSLVAGTLVFGSRFELYNSDSTDTNYRLWVEDYAGSIKHETTIVRSGGASDGTTATSRKMTTSADAEYPLIRLESPELFKWNDTVASAITATVEIVHDSQGAGSGSNFQDDEVWLEVMYLGTSGFPLGTWISDAKADVLAAAANQTASTATWTTTGLTTPVKQKLSVTFTPQEKGFLHARVVMAKASKTLYYDNKLVVT